MKKLILLFLVLVLKFVPAKAQWVTIPDANFASYLNQQFPSCMNGNQMDTTCFWIVNIGYLDLENRQISNITGIKYFDNLIDLNCRYNNIQNIPPLPNSLSNLEASHNYISTIAPLPNNLISLYCHNNQLVNLPDFPPSLDYATVDFNYLTSLPTLPDSMGWLYCSHNQLTSLPPLPISLNYFDCSYNQLTSLGELPTMYLFRCNNNQLTRIESIPNSVELFDCSFNQLSSFPRVKNNFGSFKINNNNISCLENLPNSSDGNISNNPLTCVPNQTNYSLGLPVCIDNDPINNPNNCLGVNITGTVYKDLNGNCSLNTSDLLCQNIPVKLYDNYNNFLAQSHTINGVYSFNTLLPDTYNVKIDTTNLPVSIACGQNSTQSVTLTSTNQTIQNINFPIVCNSSYDVTVQSVNTNGWVFPGQIHTLQTNVTNNSDWYNLDCILTTISCTVSITVNGPVSFVAPASGALTPIVDGNTFTYIISDFNTLNAYSFGLEMITDTTAQINDRICVHVEISPNPIDADTTNNVYDFCYNVVNSYDPNMKEVYPVNVLPGYDDWFTYTIHFQNTGNAPAFNIRLRDTLDTQLDLNTFEVLGYSHPANVGVSGNILTVRFNNIMLPDSTSDYEGSMGYFQYRLKPLPNLPNGSQISNTAYIYFDYNAPIITNTTENNFDITVPVKSLVHTENLFSLYPNPSTGVFIFKDTKNVNSVEVYSIVGEKILSQTNQKTINLNGFSKGIYFARVNGMQVVKLVKE